MIPFSFRQLLYLLTATGFAIFILTIMAYSIINVAISNYDFARIVIPSMGSVAGGIIGGIVAVIIAAYNVKKNSENEYKKQLHSTFALLLLLREEIQDNIGVLDTIIAHMERYDMLHKQLFEDTWRSSAMHLMISESLTVRLSVFYRKIALLRSFTSQEVDEGVIKGVRDVALSVFEDVKHEANEIENKLK